MKLTLALPVYNQLEETKGVWGCHIQNVADKKNTELLVINNGSTDGTAEFLERFVFPSFPDHKLINNPENVGLIQSMNQIYHESKGDIIAILHNDLYVFEYGWDTRVVKLFEDNKNIGLAGFLGASGIGIDGGRILTISNLLEAELHGARSTQQKRVLLFDGLSLICSRKMLDTIGGFDTGYTYHHFYDRDISVSSHYAGFENWYIDVACHHRSGLTANRPDYQTWIDKKMGTTGYTGDNASYHASEKHFLEKWKGKLPIIIN